jgi:hypothetical protein
VSFVIPTITYPNTYDAIFPYVDTGMMNDEVGNPFCAQCSFRPWATKGEATEATVTVVRSDYTTEKVTATLIDGRWVAATSLQPGDSFFIGAGDVRDVYGERNASGSSVVSIPL